MSKSSWFLSLSAFLLSAVFFCGVQTTHAATSLVVTTLDQSNIAAGRFDVLVYSFNLKTDKTDFVQTVTINQTGYIQPDMELAKVVLWKDAGPAGFQGFGIDDRLGKGVATSNGFVWDKLNVDINSGNNNFYVTVETTDRKFNSKRTLYFTMPAYYDANGDGIYQEGDAGIFLNSKQILPSAEMVTNQFNVVTSTQDLFAPKMTFTSNLSEDNNEFWMGGDVRDDGRAGLAAVEIKIVPSGQTTAAWVPVTFGTRAWIYRANLAKGTYKVYYRATDGWGNTSSETAFVTLVVSK